MDTIEKNANSGVRVQSARSHTDQRALQLLGSGLSASVVATACGVSESRISQLLSESDFKEEVATLRFESLNKHNEMDSKYDAMEDQLLKQLKDQLPLMQRPMEILKALQVINGAKRRGQSAPEQLTNQAQVVQLLMPVQITQRFTTNINNQVIAAGAQTLETIQSSSLLKTAKQKADGLHNELPGTTRTEIGTLPAPAGQSQREE